MPFVVKDFDALTEKKMDEMGLPKGPVGIPEEFMRGVRARLAQEKAQETRECNCHQTEEKE